MNKIALNKKGTYLKYTLIIFSAVFVFCFSFKALDLNITKFIERCANVHEVVARMCVLDLNKIPEIIFQMGISIALAFSSLCIGCVISFILSIFAADNIALSALLSHLIKGSVAIIRAVPALVWILMVVASIGFGNTGGMIGLIFPTVGYLTKSFCATIEEDGMHHVEALRAVGSDWFNMVVKGVLPAVLPTLLSWVSNRLEGNIAESISLGMLGVGGIGLILSKAIAKFDYATISTTILIIFITMFSMELITQKMKKLLNTVR